MGFKMDKLNELQQSFLHKFEELYTNLRMHNQSLLDFIENYINTHNELEIIIPHYSGKVFDIRIIVSDEIILFFNMFHLHYDNYGIEEYRTNTDLINHALSDIKLFLTSKIEISTYKKLGKVYKSTLDLIDKNGSKNNLDNWSFGFRWLLFFIPSNKEKIVTSFSDTLR